jgi:hypothetical protein
LIVDFSYQLKYKKNPHHLDGGEKYYFKKNEYTFLLNYFLFVSKAAGGGVGGAT